MNYESKKVEVIRNRISQMTTLHKNTLQHLNSLWSRGEEFVHFCGLKEIFLDIDEDKSLATSILNDLINWGFIVPYDYFVESKRENLPIPALTKLGQIATCILNE